MYHAYKQQHVLPICSPPISVSYSQWTIQKGKEKGITILYFFIYLFTYSFT